MTYYISDDRVEAPIKIGGQLCYSSAVANLLQYLYVTNYQNTMQLDKVIAKIDRVHFLPHSVYSQYVHQKQSQLLFTTASSNHN